MSAQPIGPHDLAGQEAGPVETCEHAVAHWEKQVDAMMTLLNERGHLKVDELRRGIEGLGPDAYERLTYYERWAQSMATILLEKGIVTAEEITAMVARQAARRA